MVFKEFEDSHVNIHANALIRIEYPSNVVDHLREHFRRCLHVHFCGGDIWKQYDQQTVLALMEDMGLMGGEEELAPLEDERWHTEIGREILEAHMLSGIENSEWAEESEDAM